MNDILSGAKLMQVREWGFPLGVRRSTPPRSKAFSVIHITGNSNLPSAEGEATWRINDQGLQNSASFFVNRDGSIVQALGDPLTMAPWANGDMNEPDRSNDRIKDCAVMGVNPNLRTLVAIENVGFESNNPDGMQRPITDEQVKACARIIRHYHRAADVPITRETVVGHYQINSVTRPNCPARDKSVIDRIVALARGEEEDTALIEELKEQIAYWKGEAQKRWQWVVSLRVRRDELVAEIESLEAALAETADDAQKLQMARRRIADIKAKAAAFAADVQDD